MKELAKAYNPKEVEVKLYSAWEQSGYFAPDQSKRQNGTYTIIMPPPNANGSLHMGHALGYSVQDLLIRRKRMQGFAALWFPGADHAGIETQVVFEEKVLKPQDLTRFDLGAEKFYQQVWDFTLENKKNMDAQVRLLGASCDFSVDKFTLDPDIVERVYKTFKKLHDDGLIYRAYRVVNYSIVQQTSIADIEVSFKEKDGYMYTLDYGSVKIATTRPETIFADTAVAVNPKDERYAHLVGTTVRIPLTDRDIPVIADDHVDPAVGTGALKVTPAHDFNDYEIGMRHNLPQRSVIDLQGKMINVPEELVGLKPNQAREKVVAMLDAAGLLIKKTPIKHMVGHADRTGEVIEPLLTKQWFLKVAPLVAPARAAVESNAVTIIPEHFKKPCLDWYDRMYDWCISRQIWWGIRIPVFYRVNDDEKLKPYIITNSEDEARAYYGDSNYRAETDTFDTWFSSSQWPFATLESTGMLDDFYPTQVMETGHDLIYKWVSRMIMLGLYETGKIPFETVYLHGMVNDAKGKKMSKSKGNVVNPTDLISEYGADATRFSLLYQVTGGQDLRVMSDTLKMSKTFINKIWNAARFVLMKVEVTEPIEVIEFMEKTEADAQIKKAYDEFLLSYNKQLDEYRFGQAAEQIYHFFWHQFCDIYIEQTKEFLPFGEAPKDLALAASTKNNLLWLLKNLLILLHPYIPFVTEEIYQSLPIRNKKEFIMIEDWVG